MWNRTCIIMAIIFRRFGCCNDWTSTFDSQSIAKWIEWTAGVSEVSVGPVHHGVICDLWILHERKLTPMHGMSW